MNPGEHTFLTANMIAVLAILNWISGDRPVFGMQVVLRSGSFWVALRWFGLGMYLACSSVGAERGPVMSRIALYGAVALLFGTARKRSNAGVVEKSKAKATVTDGSAGGARPE